jgi:hypothetical protein
MELRDYFAAKAMQGAIAYEGTGNVDQWTDDAAMEFARASYRVADAMIKVRENGYE